MATVKIQIYGQVQGVGFRFWLKEQAFGLRVLVAVENLDDGSVKVTAQGGQPELRKLLALAKSGPPLARVERVKVVWN